MGETRPGSGRKITSDLAGDPEMRELIQMFVDELPERIAALEQAWEGANAAEIARIAHQLKGASAGYGFKVVGDAAARLEHFIKGAQDDLAGAKSDFDALVDLCGRASA